MKHQLPKITALAMALGFAGGAQANLNFDVNGLTDGNHVGDNAFFDIMDWSPDNGLFIGISPIPASPGTTSFTYAYQATLADFGGTTKFLDAGTELTVQVTGSGTATVIASGAGIDFAIDGFSSAALTIYYDPTADANDVTGAGYDGAGDAFSILTATLGTGGASGSINVDGSNQGLLDQFGADNQGGVTTAGVSGNQVFSWEISTFDADFFFGATGPDIAGDDFTLSVDNTTPFQNANPSDAVVGSAPSYGANGINDNVDTGDLHVEQDGRSPFLASERRVPEPTTLGLLGLGLFGVSGLARRRRQRQNG